jgi:hypothetical protein
VDTPAVAQWHRDRLQWLSVATQAIHDWGALQKPGELAGLLGLVGPASTVVEVGCDRGGTLWAFRQVGARVLGVTAAQGKGLFGTGEPLLTHGAEVVIGDSHDVDTVYRLAALLAGTEVDLLFIDADHRYDAVADDFRRYGPLVRRGGLVALHDICPHPPVDLPGGGVLEVGVPRLWDELKADHKTAEIIEPPLTWGGIGIVTL